MHFGARPWRYSILASMLVALPAANLGAQDDQQRAVEQLVDTLKSALFLQDDSSTGIVLVPGLLEQTDLTGEINNVSLVRPQPLSLNDPRQLIIDQRKLLRRRSDDSVWSTSFEALAATRLDEDILVNGEEQGTGINAGGKLRFLYQLNDRDQAINAWDIIAFGFSGSSSSEYFGYYGDEKFDYEATMVSIESNVIRQTEYRNRVRQQFLGIRFVDQSDAMESIYYQYPLWRYETSNRMLGLQFGLQQSWSGWQRVRFGWGAKAGVMYNWGLHEGPSHEYRANSLPLLLELNAELAYQLLERANLTFGLAGLQLEDQYQSRFAWQDPTSKHTLRLLAVRLGFDYAY